MKKNKKGNWIRDAVRNKGALHRALGVPEDEKIPDEKMKEAMKSKDGKIRKEALLARTLRKFK